MEIPISVSRLWGEFSDPVKQSTAQLIGISGLLDLCRAQRGDKAFPLLEGDPSAAPLDDRSKAKALQV